VSQRKFSSSAVDDMPGMTIGSIFALVGGSACTNVSMASIWCRNAANGPVLRGWPPLFGWTMTVRLGEFIRGGAILGDRLSVTAFLALWNSC